MTKTRDEDPPSTREYAGEVLTGRLERMLTQAEGVLLGEDTEPVHQMRVWSRRMRAALDVFESCFRGKEFKILAREVKSVTGALGVARDLDVMIAALSKQSAALPRTKRAGIDAFILLLRTKRQAAQIEVQRAIAHLEQRDLRRRLADLLETKKGATEASGTGAGARETIAPASYVEAVGR